MGEVGVEHAIPERTGVCQGAGSRGAQPTDPEQMRGHAEEER